MSGNKENVQESKQTKTEPWAPAQPLLQGILGKLGSIDPSLTATESKAFDALYGSAMAGNPYAPAIGGLANDLLAGGIDRTPMVNAAWQQYQQALEPTARGDYLDPNKNPFFAKTTSAISDDVIKNITGMYAAAGRDGSGAGSIPMAIAEAVAKGVAPTFMGAWDRERGNALNAAGSLYNAANTTGGLLSQFDQTAFGNRRSGIDAATAATQAALDPYNRMLAIEAQRRGIPLAALQQIAGTAAPIAGLGSTSVSNATTTKETQEDPARLAIGGILGGIGLVSGNPMMAMSGLRTGVGAPMSLAAPTPGLDEWYYGQQRRFV
jgi:hypothetical protein